MNKKKEQLTREQRYEISVLLKAGHKKIEIAELLHKDKSVISREVKRNSGKQGYSAAHAQMLADERKERLPEGKERLPEGKDAKALADVMIRTLWPYRRSLHTITSDNGTEFAEHEAVAEALGVKFYFAHPYSSWERGLNENTNGFIRQYIPKGTSIDDYTDQYIKNVQHKLNSRPRKTLGFDCPKNVFSHLCESSCIRWLNSRNAIFPMAAADATQILYNFVRLYVMH